MDVSIEAADLDEPQLQRFLRDHLADLAPTAPPESRHALDLGDLRRADVRVWVARLDGRVVGTAALVPLEAAHVELKSMRTAPELRGRGVATSLLQHALSEARRCGARRVSLETGSMDFFAPARALYRRHGFAVCEPFGAYRADPNSVFMTQRIG